MEARQVFGRRRLNVLVVDKSAVVRQTLAVILGDRGLIVAAAADPAIAANKISRQRPDVIILDVETPRLDGFAFLRTLTASADPIPVVVCSSLTDQGAEGRLRALADGAAAVIEKPRVGVRRFLFERSAAIIDTLHAAARSRAPRRVTPPTPAPPAALAALPSHAHEKVVAIGASTGGTEALRGILEAMPPDAPGIVIVQHMPETFTKSFAGRLNETCRIEVKEAEAGDCVQAGRALVAPGNRHLHVGRSGSGYVVDVKDGPAVNHHRPSVDVLFRSVAAAAGSNAVGIILTGMGRDGAAGLLEMNRRGAATIAQDPASCVVFGMPREAIAAGGVDEVAPLSQIPSLLLKRTLSLSLQEP